MSYYTNKHNYDGHFEDDLELKKSILVWHKNKNSLTMYENFSSKYNSKSVYPDY